MFNQRVYDLVLRIPVGRVTTYGEIARVLGCKCYRAVGVALSKNEDSPRVPCHRVVLSSGGIGGFAFGQNKKVELLVSEGVFVKNGRIVDFENKFFVF